MRSCKHGCSTLYLHRDVTSYYLSAVLHLFPSAPCICFQVFFNRRVEALLCSHTAISHEPQNCLLHSGLLAHVRVHSCWAAELMSTVWVVLTVHLEDDILEINKVIPLAHQISTVHSVALESLHSTLYIAVCILPCQDLVHTHSHEVGRDVSPNSKEEVLTVGKYWRSLPFFRRRSCLTSVGRIRSRSLVEYLLKQTVCTASDDSTC